MTHVVFCHSDVGMWQASYANVLLLAVRTTMLGAVPIAKLVGADARAQLHKRVMTGLTVAYCVDSIAKNWRKDGDRISGWRRASHSAEFTGS